MKINLFISTVLIISLSSALATVPTYQIISKSFSINSPIDYYANGVYYFGYQYFNATSGKLSGENVLANCSDYASFTYNVVPYCYNHVVDNKNGFYHYTLSFLNAELTHTISTYDIATFTHHVILNVQLSDRFILFEFIDETTRNYNTSVYPFDLETNSIACAKENISNINGPRSVYTNGTDLIYSYLDDEDNSYFVIESCTGNDSSTTEGLTEYIEYNLFVFNSSSVFVNCYATQNDNIYSFYAQPAVYDSFKQLQFGSKFEYINFLKYNDTHMFITFTKENLNTFGFFVLNSDLEFVEIQSFNFGFNVPISAVPIYGTSQVSIILGGASATIIYDTSSNLIAQVVTQITPIFLSNGSVVNTTQYGYFIQSPGEPIYFIQAPSSTPFYNAYQDPTDNNQTYTLFVPSSTFDYYSSCLLTHFNASSSIITQTALPNCPLSLATGNPVQIKDVKYANDGTPHVCYRDSYGSLFIVNTAGSVGPYKATYLYTNIQVSMNLTNGTANFAGTLLGSIVLGRFSILTGNVLQTLKQVVNSDSNSIFKMSDRFFMLIYYVKTYVFEIYDMNSFNKTYGIISDRAAITSSPKLALFYGFSDENPYNFTGIVYIFTQSINIMNYAGETFVIDCEPWLTFYDISVVGDNQFLVTLYERQSYGFQIVYEITSWGSSPNEDKTILESIEY